MTSSLSPGLQALAEERWDDAIQLLAEASRGLRPGDEDAACVVYEGLGLAYARLGLHRPAMHALVRALDGALPSRELALRELIVVYLKCNQGLDAIAALETYEQHFGNHPSGMTSDRLREHDEEARRIAGRHRVC